MARILPARKVQTAALLETIAVASTATVYTKSFEIESGISFGVSVLATSAGTIDVQVDIEQSFDAPINEGSADYTYAIPDSTSAIMTVSAATIRHAVVNPTPLKKLRFKLTGGASNDASTTLQIWFSQQEGI